MNKQIDSNLVNEVLSFWFGHHPLIQKPEDAIRMRWFVSPEGFDQQISDKFKTAYLDFSELKTEEIESFNHWQLLSIIIVLDQFSRNIFRGTKQAFEADPIAVMCSQRLVKHEHWQDLNPYHQVFAALPFEHSEKMENQNTAVNLIKQIQQSTSDPSEFEGFYQSAIEHRDIIAQFDRFPHRNTILSRASTPEEIEFLKDGPSFGQSK